MKKKVITLLVIILLIAFIPLFALKDAEFGGSDDAGSQVVEESRLFFPANCRTNFRKKCLDMNFRVR